MPLKYRMERRKFAKLLQLDVFVFSLKMKVTFDDDSASINSWLSPLWCMESIWLLETEWNIMEQKGDCFVLL